MKRIEMTNNLASIIIVTRNREKEILSCLDSIYKMTYSKFEVILVDNASEDKTIVSVKKKFPKTIIIPLSKNFGVWYAKNEGQKKVKGKYILFLDSDTVVDKNLLSEMIKIAENDPKIGLVCPKIYYFDKKEIIWSAGAKINLLTSQASNRGVNEEDKGQYNFLDEVDYSPTAYLTTKEVAEKVNGHEAQLFMSYGESDFGYKVKEAGYRVIFCPQAKLWHRLNMEENNKTVRALGYNQPLRAYYFARNRVIFMKRHASRFNFWIFILFFFPLLTLYITYKIIVYGGSKKFLKLHLQGSADGIKFLFTGKITNNWV